MSSPSRLNALALAFMMMSCGDGRPPSPTADELANLSPEVFSHGDPAFAEAAECIGRDGILISRTGIGPVQIGRPLRVLRERCPIAYLKVPASVGIQGPVLGISASGGLIVFTIAGRDSAVETIATSSPAFRTPDGVGVGTDVRGLPPDKGSLCFKRDSLQVVRVLVARRAPRC
ncbi:MAG: hypothetical protein ACJ77R_01815 [Gemmatimonadaceae bacterium]